METANKILSNIIKRLKSVKIYNISPLDYEQEDKIKEIVLSETGLSEDSPNFSKFVTNLTEKLGLYDGDPEDNAEVLAWNTALKLGIIKPFYGWVSKTVDYTDIEDAADSEYFEDDDYPVIKNYFERHGIEIINEPEDINEDEDSVSYDDIWDKLQKMGYSEGDIVLTDDLYACLGDFPFEIGEDLDALEEEFDITFASPEDVIGDAPGEYAIIDDSDDLFEINM